MLDQSPLTVALAGASGFLGSRLDGYLSGLGHHVLRLVRREARPEAGEISWDPAAGTLAASGLEGLDGVVHLGGVGIASRWTSARKRAIRASRVESTALLARTLADLDRRPPVLVCASAIGFYGDRGDAVLDEQSEAGEGFLADLGREWEAAADPARAAGIRVAHLRFGIILAPSGGALAKMLTPFRLGLGGRLGDGRQYMSWIAREDAVRIVLRALHDDSLAGPVNAVAPEPVTNAEFTRRLGAVLRRPTPFPIPAAVVRLLFGQMGREALLASARVLPARLDAAGFRFLHTDLGEALQSEFDLAPSLT